MSPEVTSPTPYPGHIVILNDTAVIPHHGCKIVMKRIIDEVAPWGYEIKTVSVYSDWRVFQDVIDTATAVIVNGEGTLHHSADRGRRLVEVAPHCHERDIPVFLINTVWQDNSTHMADLAAFFLLRATRETRSEAQMASQGLDARTVPDLTLGWQYERKNPQRSGRLYSDAVGMPITDMIYGLFRRRHDGLYVTLEPPHAHRGSYSQWEAERLQVSKGSDRKMARRLTLIRLIKRTLILRGKIKYWFRSARGHITERPVDLFMELLESSELVITGRFHVVCLCLVTGTPFLAVASNSHKVEGMLDDAALRHRLVTPDALEHVLDNPPQWSAEDAAAAAAFVSHASATQSQLFEDIRALVVGKKSGRAS